MPSTLSIERLNLNGAIITSENGILKVNNDSLLAQTGVPISPDNTFIKGYAPFSFYTKIAINGTYLNEVYVGQEFIATGCLLACSQPGTGSINLTGRIYKRAPISVIDTSTVVDFGLQTNEYYKFSQPFSQKIYNNTIIGLDIYSAPIEMESLSIHLLGYFAGGGSFDRVPYKLNYYQTGAVPTGNVIYEDIIQHPTIITGLQIFLGVTGSGSFPTTGIVYVENVSGTIIQSGSFSIASGILRYKTGINLSGNADERFGFNIRSGCSGAQGFNLALLGYYL